MPPSNLPTQSRIPRTPRTRPDAPTRASILAPAAAVPPELRAATWQVVDGERARVYSMPFDGDESASTDGSCERAPGATERVMWQCSWREPDEARARASANDRARHLGAKLRAIAAATLDAGTSGRRAEARCEHAGVCVQINRWFGTSRPNFEILELGQIEVDSADLWTDRLLSSSSRSAADALDSKHSNKLTLKSI